MRFGFFSSLTSSFAAVSHSISPALVYQTSQLGLTARWLNTDISSLPRPQRYAHARSSAVTTNALHKQSDTVSKHHQWMIQLVVDEVQQETLE